MLTTGAGAGIGAATTALGLAATLWALLAARGVFASAGGAAIAATLLLLAVATWPLLTRKLTGAWRQHRRGPRVGAAPRLDLPLPAGLDGAAFLDDARSRFIRLQAAWDARDLQALRHLTMPDVFEDLSHVMSAIESNATRTDVLTLEANLLALEELGGAWFASVEFSGLMRESVDADAVPFRELWMLAADKGEPDSQPSWRLARQQALL